MLPRPMLLRPGLIPRGDGWAFELKYDGFRAIVSTENGLQVRSRRAWNMGDRVSELRKLPRGLVLDGELVAFNEQGAPHWPLLCERVLHGNKAVPVTFVAFDVLRVNGHDLTASPWAARRTVLGEVGVDTWCSRLADVFDDGHALFDAVCKHGLEGIVAKGTASVYRPGYRGWVKVKNPAYWRREQRSSRSVVHTSAGPPKKRNGAGAGLAPLPYPDLLPVPQRDAVARCHPIRRSGNGLS